MGSQSDLTIIEIADLGGKIQEWSFARWSQSVTIQDAAKALGISEENARLAIEEHYWMYLEADVIQHEGE